MQDVGDRLTATLRGILAMVVEERRQQGMSIGDIAATLFRAGMSYDEIAPLVDSTANAVRVGAQRARAKRLRSEPTEVEIGGAGEAQS
jgi:hypothetical protein